MRRRVVNNLKTKLDFFKRSLVSENDEMRIIKYDYALIGKLRSVLASYYGHFQWADPYHLRNAILERYSFLKEYASFENPPSSPFAKGGKHHFSVIFPSVKSQYLYYANRFRGMVIFFQVGCFYEFYTDLKKDIINILALKRFKGRRPVKYGFPLSSWNENVMKLIGKGIQVIIVKETDRYIGRIKERLPLMKIEKKGE